MKKTLLVSAVFGTFACVAHAQSNVTLYGIVDEGLSYTNNVATGGKDANGKLPHGSLFALQSGAVQGSRWGLKGTEDLGGGLSTVFQLENGFNTSTGALGQGGRMFGRQAWVGFSSTSAGTVTMGRQYDSVVDYLGPLTANGNWGGIFFAHPFDNDNTNNSFRINNSVKYTSVNYAGLQFGGLYGFSNTAGQFANNRAWSLGARYSAGPLTIGAAYLDLKYPNANSTGAQADGSNPVTAAFALVSGSGWNYARQRTGGLGASYAFGPATATVTATESAMQTPISYVRFMNVETNVRYFVTPTLSLNAMYDYTHATFSRYGSQFRPHFNTLGLMSDYLLSKRTDVYAQAVYQDGSTGTDGIVGVWSAGGNSASTSQIVARVGIRHKF